MMKSNLYPEISNVVNGAVCGFITSREESVKEKQNLQLLKCKGKGLNINNELDPQAGEDYSIGKYKLFLLWLLLILKDFLRYFSE